MQISYNPNDFEVESVVKQCPHHKKHPGTNYAECTCSGSYSWKRKKKE